MSVWRERLIRLGAACWGLAVAIGLRAFWSRPAPAGQLPGLMTSLGLDAAAAPRFVLGLMILPIVVAAVIRPASRRLAAAVSHAWAWIAFLASCMASLWFVLIEPSLSWVMAIPLLALVTTMILRRFDARFDRRDWILIPVAAAIELVLLDLTSQPVHHAAVLAVAIVMVLRLIVTRLQRTMIAPALCFALAPLAMLFQTHFMGLRQRHDPWPPLVIALITPLIFAAIRWDAARMERALSLLVRWIIYPLAILAYLSATSTLASEGLPRADLFEDAHHLVPASEMLRGETLYRDIIPAHGLIQDALLDYVALSTGSLTIGHALRFRALVGSLCILAQYAIAVAATGVAEAGLGAAILVVLLGTSAGTVRALPSLFVVACAVLAIRTRQPRAFVFAGTLAVVSILTSLDFGAYATLSLLLALLRYPSIERDRASRARPWILAGAGAVGAGLVALAAMGVAGFAGAFLRASLIEIPSLRTVYALAPFDAPSALQSVHNVPEVLAMLFDKSAYLYLLWIAAALFVATAMTARKPGSNEAGTLPSPHGSEACTERRFQAPPSRLMQEAALIVAFFTMVTAFSYAERHHTYWQFGIPALLAIALYGLTSNRSPLPHAAGALLILVVLVAAQPTTHLAIAASLRRTRGPVDPEWRTLDLPRAHGALFRVRDARAAEIVKHYAESHLRPDETFFDFTNRGGLYFLLDRDCPIRQIEVAFYEPPERQNDVIARIESNARIRFALVPAANHSTYVDGVPNETRAPLVWTYLQQHFTPDYEEDGVVFWRRNEAQPPVRLR